MPNCGSQIILCNVPVRFDTYKGCSHNCKYCFTYRKYDISNIKVNETEESLKKFINGYRNAETKWCDWGIPLHWGGMSDPFQPFEKNKKISLKCLKVFADTKYPFVVSTKSILPTEDNEYFELFKKCNCVYQVSMLCSEYDKFESGAPTYNQRLKSISKMSGNVHRTIVRLQPYILDYHKQIISNLSKLKEAGTYGVTVEGMKMQKKVKGMVKIGADFCYPKNILKFKFQEIKEECHRLGLKFFCGENRLRNMGDSLTCCGCEGIEGWKVNKANLNQFLFDKENYKFRQNMCVKGEGTNVFLNGFGQSTIIKDGINPNKKATGGAFVGFAQNMLCSKEMRDKKSFKELMQLCEKDKKMIDTFLSDK